MTRLLVIGSANVDHVMTFEQLPKAGQTLMSDSYRIEHGGKGANQAVACARLKQPNTQVNFICALGQDAAADTMLQSWQQEGIGLEHIRQFSDASTGCAMIFVSAKGENSIGVAPGANACLTAAMIVQLAPLFAETDSLLIQLETPLESVRAALQQARLHQCHTILNPAPAAALDNELLALVDIITPNETEAEMLTGIEVTDAVTAAMAAQELHRRGIPIVIITLGCQGAFLSQQDQQGQQNFRGVVPAYPVTPVDTVAAGDTFNGALMVGLAEGMAITKAIDFANKAAAIAVTRHGAQRGIPRRSELS